MKVYFDNAASTKILPQAAEKMVEVMTEYYANPSASSIMGMEADNILKASAKTLARLINANEGEIYFTSGGTEGDNWAVFGTAKGYNRSGKHIITTVIEHPAVAQPFKQMEDMGYEVTYLPVDEKGYVSAQSVRDAVREDTILVSIILINNEIGTIQNAEEIGKAIKEKNSSTLFHLDAVQAFGKYKIDVKKFKCDMLSASAHKFNGPKGVGFFYMKKGLKVRPVLFGGGQQNGHRPGTENPAGAAAMAVAAEDAYKNYEESTKHVFALKKHLADRILNEISDTFVNGEDIEKASPYVLNMGFKNLRSEVLLHALEEKGVVVSAGSACNSRKKVQSSVLGAIGLGDDDIQGSIRFSFSRFNTIEEADYCVDVLKETVAFLRRFNRKR
ncbi:MAG: cysteine desulfurase [Firmicutes bacterium]|nr:cysteine desulfurase [Bacillota bacterium]